MPYIPPKITFFLTAPGVTQGDPSLFDLNVTSSTLPADYPLGWIDGWCADDTTGIGIPTTYTGTIYSTYEYNILRANPHFATVGDQTVATIIPSVPHDLTTQPYLANLDIVNWLLGHITIDTTTYSDTIHDVSNNIHHLFTGIHY